MPRRTRPVREDTSFASLRSESQTSFSTQEGWKRGTPSGTWARERASRREERSAERHAGLRAAVALIPIPQKACREPGANENSAAPVRKGSHLPRRTELHRPAAQKLPAALRS